MPTADFGTVSHIIVAGDTLSQLAHDYNSTVDNIKVFNHMTNPNLDIASHCSCVSTPSATILNPYKSFS